MAIILERCADLAVAVVELARREAAVGNPEAIAWIEAVRADLIAQAPPALAERWAAAAPPAELLAEAYRARKASGVTYREAIAELGGGGRAAQAMWNDAG